MLEECGNNILDPGEQCDDAKNGNNDDGCTDSCTFPVCGDTFVQPSLGEQCDNGNTNSDTNNTEDCGNWTNGGILSVGREGRDNVTNGEWTNTSLLDDSICSTKQRPYCFEQ